jgi:cell division protein FtsA
MIKGTKELAKEILNMEVNLGIPNGISGGLIKEVESPIFATGVGLILHRMKNMEEISHTVTTDKKQKRKKLTPKGIFSKVKAWFDEL